MVVGRKQGESNEDVQGHALVPNNLQWPLNHFICAYVEYN